MMVEAQIRAATRTRTAHRLMTTTPCQDDCGHECVASQGKVESDTKSAREIIQVWMDVDLGSILESAWAS